MSLLIKKYTIVTALSSEEVLRSISKNTEIKQGNSYGYFYSTAAKQQRSIIPEDRFDLKKYQNYKRGFGSRLLLIISAHIIPGSESTQIKIKMRLPVFNLIFLMVWLGAIGTGIIVNIFKYRKNLSNVFSSDLIALLTMFLFGLLLLFLSVTPQANDSKEFLKSILKGREIK